MKDWVYGMFQSDLKDYCSAAKYWNIERQQNKDFFCLKSLPGIWDGGVKVEYFYFRLWYQTKSLKLKGGMFLPEAKTT